MHSAIAEPPTILKVRNLIDKEAQTDRKTKQNGIHIDVESFDLCRSNKRKAKLHGGGYEAWLACEGKSGDDQFQVRINVHGGNELLLVLAEPPFTRHAEAPIS